MNFKELMDTLDKIWDEHNRIKLKHPEYARQFQPENWDVKICTQDDSWGGHAGTRIENICTGIDWDSNTILIFTKDPIRLESKE